MERTTGEITHLLDEHERTITVKTETEKRNTAAQKALSQARKSEQDAWSVLKSHWRHNPDTREANLRRWEEAAARVREAAETASVASGETNSAAAAEDQARKEIDKARNDTLTGK